MPIVERRILIGYSAQAEVKCHVVRNERLFPGIRAHVIIALMVNVTIIPLTWFSIIRGIFFHLYIEAICSIRSICSESSLEGFNSRISQAYFRG